MKIFKLSIVIGIMLTAATTYSQQNTGGVIIKYDIMSLLGDQVTNSMGIMMGVEYFAIKDKSFSLNAMYIFPCANCEQPYTSISTEKTNGFSLSAENRYYLFPGKSPFTGFHLGPQIYYQYTIADMRETYNDGVENIYQVYRNLFAAHAMAGYQLRIAGSLFFDPSLGLGLRYISSRNENKKGNDSGQYEYPYNKDYESGAKWFPSFIMNLKIGLKL